jgi:hypothetical protein
MTVLFGVDIFCSTPLFLSFSAPFHESQCLKREKKEFLTF